MKRIKRFFEKLEPKAPMSTGVKPEFHSAKNIKAVIFDIYGTLLISASGDIEEAEMRAKNILTAFKAAGVTIEMDNPSEGAGIILVEFAREIKAYQRLRKSPEVEFPEIDIRIVWRSLLRKMYEHGVIAEHVDDDQILEIAYIFELLSNPVYPMPGMRKIIEKLRTYGIPLGIVSNAQFYTPSSVNYFLSGKLDLDASGVDGFDDDLSIFSYQHLRGKPDEILFRKLFFPLKRKYKILPSETLFVGNDMKKDILPAQKAGFRTALFAGDLRSLRMRENDPMVEGVKPDHIITKLKHIKEICRC